ncbi:MAG: hypothetical protein HY901_13025 [Deltaproteobacteria bacterium]|nr:hypothetical protein [Deltaproteobacteria bacterium]
MKRIIKRVTETWIDPDGDRDTERRSAVEDEDESLEDGGLEDGPDGQDEDEPRPSRRRR